MSRKSQRRFNKVCAVFLLAATLEAASPLAHASTEGRMERTSSGTIRISVTKVMAVNISGQSDLAAAPGASGAGVTLTNDLCVYSTDTNAGNRVIASGAPSAGGSFVMNNGSKTMPYAVAWNAGGTGNLSNQGVALAPGVPSAPLGNASTDRVRCRGNASGPTARLIVSVPPEAMATAAPGSYSESLTLLLSPN